MPHVTIKMYSGRTDQQKQELAEAIAADVVDIAGCARTAVSVAVEEFEAEEWPEAVYRPEILGKSQSLVIEPGYNPFDE